MSSGRIGMILTYTRNKNNNNTASRTVPTASRTAPTASRTAPTVPTVPTVPTIIKSSNPPKRMSRFTSISMSNIIHKPASSCSSCGN